MGVQVLSYDSMNGLNSASKIKRILDVVKKGDIVMIEGQLDPQITTDLFEQALRDVSGKFTGIEPAYITSKRAGGIWGRIKESIITTIAKDRMGITVIGPSKVIKEIKMNPDKLEILFK